MKNTIILLLFGLLVALPAFADVVDEGLPPSADQALKAHTRAMIKAGVNAQEGLNMTRTMLQHHYQNQHIINAQERVMEAARQGLPTEPVMNKAKEGMAKNVPPDRVVQAMAQVQGRYAKAHSLASGLNLDAQARHQVGNLMAEAMTARMTEDAGNRIMLQLQAKAQTLNHSMANQLAIQTAMTTREMARLGVNADRTAEVICLALQNQYQAREMAQLRQQFRDQAHQEDPQQLAQQFAHSLHQGVNSGTSGYGDSSNGAGSSGSSGSGTGSGGGSSGSGAGSGGSGAGGGGSGAGGGGSGGPGGGK